MRPLTRFLHRRKLDSIGSRRMISMKSRSNKLVRSAISSKLVQSSYAIRTMLEICSYTTWGQFLTI